jgi:tetratricopeptide (TPR) repeat protein
MSGSATIHEKVIAKSIVSSCLSPFNPLALDLRSSSTGIGEIKMKVSKLTAALVAASFALTVSAFAIPGAGTDTTKAKTADPIAPTVKQKPTVKAPSAKKQKCKRGETVKVDKKKGQYKYSCTKLKADVSPDSELYQQARLLADEGEYEWALDHLRTIRVQNNAEVLNYTGYANRKAGRLETGIGYYQQALALNPDYVQAREYLGEAYVLAGFNDLALQQLQEIENRSGTSSEAYVALKKFMQDQRSF